VENSSFKRSEKPGARQALDAPRIKAEDEQDHETVAAYYACLVSSVKTLSQESNELAQVIVQAAYPSCLAERNAAFTIMKTHHPYLDSDVMVAIDNDLEPFLLLDVIKDRAPPTAPQP
jgi:hypothetical protein